eukprot:3153142-Pleurochrysis_carterae.AAC.2
MGSERTFTSSRDFQIHCRRTNIQFTAAFEATSPEFSKCLTRTTQSLARSVRAKSSASQLATSALLFPSFDEPHWCLFPSIHSIELAEMPCAFILCPANINAVTVDWNE